MTSKRILHITVGTYNNKQPTKKQLQTVIDLFRFADGMPGGAYIATSPLIKARYIYALNPNLLLIIPAIFLLAKLIRR